MSKTDHTRPQWVRMADTPMSTARPLHDHRFGACTLPERITPTSTGPHLTKGCRWVVTAAFAPVRTDGGAGEWSVLRRAQRRRERHEVHRRLRRGLLINDPEW